MKKPMNRNFGKLDEMEPVYKRQKVIEKAAIKFGKNIEKVRKSLEKYRDKARTQEERDVGQTLLDSLSVQNTED